MSRMSSMAKFRRRSTIWLRSAGSCSPINVFGTVAIRKVKYLYVSVWYTLGAVIWTTFVYITGNMLSQMPMVAGVKPGQPDLVLCPQCRRPDLYPAGCGDCLLPDSQAARYADLFA